MGTPEARVLLHVARDRGRAVDFENVHFLEAGGETTQVRPRFARHPLGDGRPAAAFVGEAIR